MRCRSAAKHLSAQIVSARVLEKRLLQPERMVTYTSRPKLWKFEVDTLWKDMLAHLGHMKEQMGAAFMVVDNNPIFVCQQGATKRGLDLEVAAADAENWVKVGLL